MLFPSMMIFLLRTLAIQSEVINDPSLKPAQPFSASDDADSLREEIKHYKSKKNRDKIAKTMFHRTYEQRHEIDIQYNQKFCPNPDKHPDHCPFHSAVKDISLEATEDLYTASLLPPEGLLAKTIYDSIKSGDGEAGAIEEVVCANDKAMKDRINDYYKTNYQTTVEEHLATFHSEDQAYQEVLLKYCWKGQCQDKKLTPDDAKKEAQALQNINLDTNKEDFKNRLSQLLNNFSEPDLKQIFENYNFQGSSIDDAVDKVFEVHRVRRAYNILVSYLENTVKFYAQELHNTIHSILTTSVKTSKINRIVLSRCERDLLAITKEYHDTHDETFTHDLHKTLWIRFAFWKIWLPQDHYVECIRYLCGKP